LVAYLAGILKIRKSGKVIGARFPCLYPQGYTHNL